MKLSPDLNILIPVYNEEKTIIEVLSKINKVCKPIKNKSIIVIDDGSTDGTHKLLEKNKKLYNKLVTSPVNKGKGSAIILGLNVVSTGYVLIQDADLEYDPNEYDILLRPILDNHADVVFGSRFMGGRPHRVLYFWHSVGNRFLTLLSNMFTNLNLTDMETCYKVFRREIIQSIVIKENRFGFEPEITAKIAKTNCRIYEVGISYNGRTYDEGKKIGWKDGFRAIYCIFKYNLFK